MQNAKVAGKTPQMESLEADKNYAWCACGMSNNQPWCDGAHKVSGMAPKVFKAESTAQGAMCMCKQTKNPPYCDGSHNAL